MLHGRSQQTYCRHRMNEKDQQSEVQEFLQFLTQRTIEWVPRYQLAPRNQVNTSLSYTPDVTCAIDELDFDAHVTLDRDQRPHYHFSVATPLALSSVAMTLTASEHFMPDVPLNRSLIIHEDSKKSRLHNFVDYRYLRESDGLRFPRRTTDPRRLPIGDSLFALALQFIALHEEGHYLNGHLDPNLNFCERGTYSERRNVSSAVSADELLNCRALELDADHFALTTMLSPLLQKGTKEYLSAMPSKLGETRLGYARFLGSASMVLGLILWQAEGGMSGPPAEKRTHPTPFCRITHFSRITSAIVAYLSGTDEGAQIWDDAINHDVGAMLNLFGLDALDFQPEAGTPWSNEWVKTHQRLIQLKSGMSEAAARAREAVGIDPSCVPGDVLLGPK